MLPLLDVPEELVVVGTMLPLTTALILPRLSKVEELRGEVKDRKLRASGEAEASVGDDLAQEVEGGTIRAGGCGPGDEESHCVHAGRPRRREGGGVT